MTENYDTIVIGAGQAGLSIGYHLAQRGKRFVILDAADQVGGSWHHRWDSMRLFTPSTHDGLPGMPYPSGFGFPTRAEIVAYLQSYAERFALPVRTGVTVDGLFRQGDGWRVTSGADAYDAANVVLAIGSHRVPKVPSFASELSDEILQLHTVDYRNPGQLRPGPVLVVGAGNSGADIAIELAATHQVLLSGRHPGQLPIDIDGFFGRTGFPVIWWVWEHVLNEKRPPGRKVRAQALQGHSEPLIRLKDKDIVAAGVERRPRIAGIVDGLPQTVDGEVLEVTNVLWATGFKPDFAWIDVPGLDSSGRLASERGAVVGQPGLFVLGQEFQYMFNSHTVGGVGKDAAYVARLIERRSHQLVEPALAGKG